MYGVKCWKMFQKYLYPSHSLYKEIQAMMLQRCWSLRASNSAESRVTQTVKHFNHTYIGNVMNYINFLSFGKDSTVQERSLVVMIPNTSSLSYWEGRAAQDKSCFCCWYTWYNKSHLDLHLARAMKIKKGTSAAQVRPRKCVCY